MPRLDTFFEFSRHDDLRGKVILVQGHKQTGRTELCKYILEYIKNHSEETIFEVINGTYAYFHPYEDIIKTNKVHTKYTKELVLNFVSDNRFNLAPIKVFLLEDCLWNNDWTKDTSMQYLFRQGKDSQFTTIICTRHILKIPQSLLRNIDYYFVAAEDHQNTLRTFTATYGTIDYSNITLQIGTNLRPFDFVVLNKKAYTFSVPLNCLKDINVIQRTIRRYIAKKEAQAYIEQYKKRKIEQIAIKEVKDTQIKIKSFDPRRAGIENKVIMIYGTRARGKTELVKYFVEIVRSKYPDAYLLVQSPTIQEWDSCTPNESYESFNQESLRDVVKQEKSYRIVVLDGSLYDSSWMKNRYVRALFMNGIKENITLIVTLQHPINISPLLKGSCNFVFISRSYSEKERTNYYKQYGSFAKTQKEFNKVFGAVTKSHNFMGLQCNANDLPTLDNITWFNVFRQRKLDSQGLEKVGIMIIEEPKKDEALIKAS